MDHTSMIERKLTGVVSTIQVDIPFDAFDSLVTYLNDHLEYCDVNMAKADVAVRQGVLQAFEQGVRALLAEIDWNDVSEYVDIEDTVELLFPEELKKAQEEEEERNRIAIEEYERAKAEMERQQAEREASKASSASAEDHAILDPDAITVVVKNRFVRKLIQIFGEKA